MGDGTRNTCGRTRGRSTVSSLPMRDGNPDPEQGHVLAVDGFEPTYEGWKPCWATSFGTCASVSSLPMRDGNSGDGQQACPSRGVSSLPMRDGNASRSVALACGRFVSSLPMRDGNYGQ